VESLIDSLLVFRPDGATAQRWAEVTAHRRQTGYRIECGDAWIAATALRYDLPLLTHNAKGYRDIPGRKTITHADTPP
jgi:tRNA(fMet)-specific endonuclease VapC